jgi:ribosomal protein L22
MTNSQEEAVIRGRARANLSVSPQKLSRFLLLLKRGEALNNAICKLSVMHMPSAALLQKLIVNAKNNMDVELKKETGRSIDVEQVRIEKLLIDKGKTLKRFRFASKGGVDKRYRRSSILSVELSAPVKIEEKKKISKKKKEK